MADFNQAIEVVFKHEGFFSNIPEDRGGATKYGISLRFLGRLSAEGDLDGDGDIDIDDIKVMTKEQAEAFYKSKFWDKNRYGEIEDQLIAEKLFDYAVNMGNKRANIFLQTALNKAYNGHISLAIDGIIGNITLITLNNHVSMYGRQYLLALLDLQAVDFYRGIVNRNRLQQKFLLGWLNRVFE
jgi:lysozyme family protein